MRLCRRDTESHPEYALLLSMNGRFEAECPNRGGTSALVTEACCREKSAYFILGPGGTAVGYVAAIVAANRRVVRAAGAGEKTHKPDADATELQVPDSVPTILQLYVEHEFRCRGLATAALALLLRGHNSLMVDEPTWPVIRMLEGLGFTPASAKDGPDGRPMVLLAKMPVVADL